MSEHYTITDDVGGKIYKCNHCDYATPQSLNMLHHQDAGRKERCKGRDWTTEDAERQARPQTQKKNPPDTPTPAIEGYQYMQQRVDAVKFLTEDSLTKRLGDLAVVLNIPPEQAEPLRPILKKILSLEIPPPSQPQPPHAAQPATNSDEKFTRIMDRALDYRMQIEMIRGIGLGGGGGDGGGVAQRYTEDRINRLEQAHKEEIIRLAQQNKENLERIEKAIERGKANEEKEEFEDKIANIIGVAIKEQNDKIEELQTRTEQLGAQQQTQLQAEISKLTAQITANATRQAGEIKTPKDAFALLADRIKELEQQKVQIIEIGKFFGLSPQAAEAKARTTIDMVKEKIIDKLGDEVKQLIPGFKDVVSTEMAGQPPPPSLTLPPSQPAPVPGAPPPAAPETVPLAQITELTMNQTGALVVPPKYLDAVKAFATQNSIPFEDYSTHIIFAPAEVPKVKGLIEKLPG